jgi:hypothetical protein
MCCPCSWRFSGVVTVSLVFQCDVHYRVSPRFPPPIPQEKRDERRERRERRTKNGERREERREKKGRTRR